MELEDKLTILIPTFNRRERLLATLHSLSSQGHWGEYNVVIVDNCSNYNVEDTIRENLPDGFVEMITVQRWFFNTGMSTNISIAFEFVNTKWCWFISDDDEILHGALITILDDTKRYTDKVAIKYSIKDFCKYDNSIIKDVNEWACYYQTHFTGDMGYLSMLYNISLLYPYLSELTVHSYSYLSFWLPVIRALNETNANMVMSSDELIDYKKNSDGWSSSDERYLNTLLGIRTLFDFSYGLNSKTVLEFNKVFTRYLFNAKDIVVRILFLPDKNKRSHYYNLLNNYFHGRFCDKLISLLFFRFVMAFNISPKSVKKMMHYKNKMN